MDGVTDPLLEHLTTALGAAYSLDRELPGGGMSRVFVAREQALGREVVIKVLPPELAAGINRQRFRQEIQLAARISHPYIVPLLHAGEADELLWFTMPYIAGESLRTQLQNEGPATLPVGLRLLRDVAEALAHAHSRGVIHRDIKPANVLIDGQHALVTDFGVAKALGASLPMTGVAGHTTSGMAIGTPAYMAPEQLAADPSADHRVDIYAFGLLAYELFIGASPFAAPSPTAIMTAQLTRTPEPLSKLRPGIPVSLSNLVARCLDKSADRRPATAQELVEELDRISGALMIDAHLADSGDRVVQARGRASAWPLVLAGVAMLVLVIGGLWAARRNAQIPATAARVDTLVLNANNDAAGEAPLSLTNGPLTRADSLAIAAALRDELQRIDPPASATPVAPAFEPTLSLERQLAMADSLIRSRLGALSGITAEAMRSAGEMQFEAPDAELPHRIMILAPPSRDSDQEMEIVARRLAAELSNRLARGDDWEVVEPRRTSPNDEEIPADVFVTVGVSRDSGDTASVRIGVRNVAPGSSFGFNVISARAVPGTDPVQSFAGTLRDAQRVIEGLRRVPRGGRWGVQFAAPRN